MVHCGKVTDNSVEIEVYRAGTPVLIGDHIEGVITSILIRSNDHILYEIGWWDKNTYNSKYFEEFEVVSPVKEKQRVGFSRQPDFRKV